MPDEKEYQVYISGIRRGSCYPETEVNCINAKELANKIRKELKVCLLYTSPSPRD